MHFIAHISYIVYTPVFTYYTPVFIHILYPSVPFGSVLELELILLKSGTGTEPGTGTFLMHHGGTGTF
jgi:hypothetical protein